MERRYTLFMLALGFYVVGVTMAYSETGTWTAPIAFVIQTITGG